MVKVKTTVYAEKFEIDVRKVKDRLMKERLEKHIQILMMNSPNQSNNPAPAGILVFCDFQELA